MNNKINTSVAYKVLEKQGINKPQSDVIINNAVKLFNHIPNSLNNKESNVGLLVGKVQSGKTSVMIASSAVAFENGSRLIIALLSDTELLLTQNYNRIVSTFDGFEDIEVVQVSKNGDFIDLSYEDLKFMHEHGKKIFVCALKNKTRLSNIIKKFKETGYDQESVLIFDDEGDDISQNTKRGKDKFAKDESGNYYEKGFSATNKSIKELKGFFRRVGYVSVTATPQSIVLLQNFQHLSPDFVLTSTPGVGYCGLSYFHAEHRDELIAKTSDDETVLKGQQGIPSGLKRAMAHFIAGCIIREQRENKPFKHSMMIHTSRLIVDHNTLFNKVQPYIKFIRDGIKKTVSTTSQKFINLVQEEYDSMVKTSKRLTNEQIRKVFESLKVTPLNSESDLKDIKSIMKHLPYHLFIGGDLLDRGVTIDGLAVVYIVRQSKKAAQMDTLLQRARWFGYKYDYIDTCKVYLTPKLDQQFMEMVKPEEAIWDMLQECSAKELSPRDIDFEFEMNTNLIIPTSKSKATFENAISGLKVEQKYVMMTSKLNDQNIKLIESFMKINKSRTVKTKYGPQTHDKVTLPLKDALQFLNAFHLSHQEKMCNYIGFYNTCKFLKYKDTDPVEILLMHRPGGVEERSTVEPDTNELIGLLQGHSPNKSPTDPTYYKGDRYLVENKIMIQIHMVTLKTNVSFDNKVVSLKKGSLTPMLAWFFPQSDYTKMVIKKKIL